MATKQTTSFAAAAPRTKRKATVPPHAKGVVHGAPPEDTSVFTWRKTAAFIVAAVVYAVIGAGGISLTLILTELAISFSLFLALMVYLLGICLSLYTAVYAAMGTHAAVLRHGGNAFKSVARRLSETRAWIFTRRSGEQHA